MLKQGTLHITGTLEYPHLLLEIPKKENMIRVNGVMACSGQQILDTVLSFCSAS